MTTRRRPRLQGVVAEYGDHAGFGIVEAEPAGSGGKAEPAGSGGKAEPAGSGGKTEHSRYWFHCTQIADGSRHVEVGQAVTFRVVPGHHGRWEAAEIA